MTPASSSFSTRSRTAGADISTRRASSEMVIRGSSRMNRSRVRLRASNKNSAPEDDIRSSFSRRPEGITGAIAAASAIRRQNRSITYNSSVYPGFFLRNFMYSPVSDQYYGGMDASAAPPRTSTLGRVPPHVFFLVSALFHYLGPAFAVLLFQQLAPLGVAWLRIASAAIVFALWRRPWRFFGRLSPAEQATILALGAVLAAMNFLFFEAIARLPFRPVG